MPSSEDPNEDEYASDESQNTNHSDSEDDSDGDEVEPVLEPEFNPAAYSTENNFFNMSSALKKEAGQVVFTVPEKRFRYLTKYEYTRIKGIRMQQLSNGSPTYLAHDNYADFDAVFEEELKTKKLPFILVRHLGQEHPLYFRLRDLECLDN